MNGALCSYAESANRGVLFVLPGMDPGRALYLPRGDNAEPGGKADIEYSVGGGRGGAACAFNPFDSWNSDTTEPRNPPRSGDGASQVATGYRRAQRHSYIIAGNAAQVIANPPNHIDTKDE